MTIQLYAALTNVIVPGEVKPPNCWLYAIIYRQNKEVSRMWLSEAYAVDDDPTEELAQFMGTGGRNPLKLTLPDGKVLDYPDKYGEYFKLADGSLAQVFNRDKRRS